MQFDKHTRKALRTAGIGIAVGVGLFAWFATGSYLLDHGTLWQQIAGAVMLFLPIATIIVWTAIENASYRRRKAELDKELDTMLAEFDTDLEKFFAEIEAHAENDRRKRSAVHQQTRLTAVQSLKGAHHDC